MVSILCIDDDPDAHDYLNLILPKNCRLSSIRHEAELDKIKSLSPDLVLVDIDFGQGIGRRLLGQLRFWWNSVPIIVHSHSQNAEDIVLCLREGVSDFISKPISRQCLLAKLGSINLFGTPAIQFNNDLETYLGSGKAASYFRQIASGFGQPGSSCLISGPSGCGKYPVAKALHEHIFSGPLTLSRTDLRDCFRSWSPRGKSKELQEHDLFGGSSIDQTSGILKNLDGGTLLLEEIEHLDLSVQQRIARVLNHGHAAFGHDTRDSRIRLRLVVLTSRNPLDLRRESMLDGELMHLIFPSRLVLPGLRHRSSDIAGLAWYYMGCIRSRVPEIRCRRISPAALEKLVAYSWPGNLLELRQCITDACIRSQNEELLPEDLFFSGPII